MIRSMQKSDILEIKKFTDHWIGENYYSVNEIEECLELAQSGGLNASLVDYENDELVGVRLTFAPGKWIQKARGVTPDRWECDPSKVSYFKSLFVHEDHQQKGIGRQLSNQSIEILKQMGAKAIICHSWLESPGNSSQRYLQRMGFSEVARHEKFWYPIDYHCTRCGPERCVCTAVEMIKYL